MTGRRLNAEQRERRRAAILGGVIVGAVVGLFVYILVDPRGGEQDINGRWAQERLTSIPSLPTLPKINPPGDACSVVSRADRIVYRRTHTEIAIQLDSMTSPRSGKPECAIPLVLERRSQSRRPSKPARWTAECDGCDVRIVTNEDHNVLLLYGGGAERWPERDRLVVRVRSNDLNLLDPPTGYVTLHGQPPQAVPEYQLVVESEWPLKRWLFGDATVRESGDAYRIEDAVIAGQVVFDRENKLYRAVYRPATDDYQATVALFDFAPPSFVERVYRLVRDSIAALGSEEETD